MTRALIWGIDIPTEVADPWHGLWTEASGKLLSPTGVESTPVNPPTCTQNLKATWPDTSLIPIPSCDAILVRKPGLPAVTTPDSELEAGKTWLNYNILAGTTRRIAGKNANGYIYITPSGLRWRVMPGSATAKSRVLAGDGSITLTFSRFGQCYDTPPNQSSGAMAFTFTLGHDRFPGDSLADVPYSLQLDDVNETGSKALFAVCRAGSWFREVVAVIEITLSGDETVAASLAVVAEDASCTWSAGASGTSVYKYGRWAVEGGSWVGSLHDDPPADGRISSFIVSQSATLTQEQLVGGRYSSAGVREILKGSYVSTMSGSATPSLGDAPGGTYYGTFRRDGSTTQSEVATLSANGVTIKSLTSGTTTSGYDYCSGPVSSGSAGVVARARSYDGINHADTIAGLALPSGADILPRYFVRYSNTLYGITGNYIDPVSGVAGYYWHGMSGKLASTTERTFAATVDPQPRFACEHPVTGQIVRSTTPLCFL